MDYTRFPNVLIPIKMEHSFWHSQQYTLAQAGTWSIGAVEIELLPAASGIAFFLSAEISLSLT